MTKGSIRGQPGICHDCTSPSAAGRIRCQYHLDKSNEQEAIRLGKKKRDGICRQCKLSALVGYLVCEYHRTSTNISYARYTNLRRSQNKCVVCGVQNDRTGKNRCTRCSEANRVSRWRKVYGLAADDYYKMVESQNGQCAICGIPDDELCVDHDHETGKIRSLLCHWCNKRLGILENFEWTNQAFEYLVKWGDT